MEDVRAATLFLSLRLTKAAPFGLTSEETQGLSYMLACIADGLGPLEPELLETA
jgi:hypothetical protein